MSTNPQKQNLIAKASIDINASKEQVWDALVNPEKVSQYMFGSKVKSDFKPNSSISFTGEYNGKPYEEKGTVLNVVEGQELKYKTCNMQSGQQDSEENYHTITIRLSAKGNAVNVTLEQDNNENEKMQEQSSKNWEGALKKMKEIAEKK